MVRAVAAAYATRGIRVNTVVPGYTETPLVTAISSDPADRAAIVSRIPLGRPGTAGDVEGIMVYLASDESSYAPGAIFRVDGGARHIPPISLGRPCTRRLPGCPSCPGSRPSSSS
jgi:NAD(P)-dependent dehydrogenase (short-subunit alcohol dehydrogenase family)